MAVTQTGNAEIDQQHEILDDMVCRLQTLCTESARHPEPSCGACGRERLQHCRAQLVSTVNELRDFLIGHATYEERMMDLLPDTPTCQAHIKAHKAAHEGVARHLKRLATQIAGEMPSVASAEIWQVIGTWLGDHCSVFDSRLVRIARSANPEINFDNELVDMLDLHVFPNRPSARKAIRQSSATAQKVKAEVRGRFESLTPAQRKVFWQVAAGRKNIEIAEELGITTNTVKTHRAVIFQKMGVNSVVELIKKTDLLR